MNRLFVVKKPGVIECKYYESGSIYKPSARMSDIALSELIKYDFLEEKPLAKDTKKILDDYLISMQVRCGYMKSHLDNISIELKEARKKLEEM